jgi:hypothetical protein
MKSKLIGIFVCILLLLTLIPISTIAENDSRNPVTAKSKIRFFIFCDIDILTSGRAFLFPGYLDSVSEGTNVSVASGLCFVGNESYSGTIKLKGIEINNWQWMFVVFYTGFLKNYWSNLPPKPKHIFSLDGSALLVIVSYN